MAQQDVRCFGGFLGRPQADLEPLLAKSTAAKDAGGVELLVVLQDILQVRRHKL